MAGVVVTCKSGFVSTMEVTGITVIVVIVIVKMPPKKKKTGKPKTLGVVELYHPCERTENGKFKCRKPPCTKQGCGNCKRHCNCDYHAKKKASGTRKPLKNITNLQPVTLSPSSFEELEQKSIADFDRLEQEGEVCRECESD
jgi:hypothetical protein